MKCWGDNTYGQLGLGNAAHRGDNPGEMGDALPSLDFGANEEVVKISAGSTHACALFKAGTIKCWGRNYRGELGLGHLNRMGDNPNEMGDDLPVVDLGTGVIAVDVATGGEFGLTCAILSNGGVKCWGENEHGELGQGDKQYRGDNPGEMGDNLPYVPLW